MSQSSHTREERFAITMGILLITLTALGAWLMPPMPCEAGLFGLTTLVYGIIGPLLRRRTDRRNRKESRIARQKAREDIYQ